MPVETVFRLLFLVLLLALLAVRHGYQWQLRRHRRVEMVREGRGSRLIGALLVAGGAFFAAAYLLAPGLLAWSYLSYPLWLRGLGAALMAGGVALLTWAHRHLGQNFHALVALHSEQTLVISGPYRWMRHPMYTAFLLFDVGCGLLSANLVLTWILPVLLIMHVALRLGREEQLLAERFDPAYRDYAQKTARFFPHLRFTS